jgi:ADP-heptose:LPS heptosyltransferase
MSQHEAAHHSEEHGSLGPIPYCGEPLGVRPHVAVIFRDQIGDFVVATPLMRGLHARYPDLVLDYFGGERTRELEEASRLIDARFSLYGSPAPLERLPGFLGERRAAAGPYALAINLESDPLAGQACGLLDARYVAGAWIDATSGTLVKPPHGGIDRLWHDLHWNRAELLADYPQLRSPYIGELFLHLARVGADPASAEVPVDPPPFPTPPLLISTGANRPAKLWPAEHWLTLVGALRARGQSIGLLGAPPALGAYHADDVDAALVTRGVQDLRGRLTLPEVAGALAHSHAFVTVDNGLMHLAAAVGTPTIAIFGASPRRLWAPPVACVRVLEPTDPCPRCEQNRFRNADCLLPVHQCLLSVSPDRVRAELTSMLNVEPAGRS